MSNFVTFRIGGTAGRSRAAARLGAALLPVMLGVLPHLFSATPVAAAETESAQPAPQPQTPQPQPPQPQPPKEEAKPNPEPTPPPPPPPPPKGETPATVLDDKEVDGILGKEIHSASGESMGRIVDVIVNRGGQVRAAIIDFGGFLGVGSRKIAVDWRAIHFAPDGKLDRIVSSLTRNEVRLAPEYKHGEPIVVLGAPAANQPSAATQPQQPQQPQQAPQPQQSQQQPTEAPAPANK